MFIILFVGTNREKDSRTKRVPFCQFTSPKRGNSWGRAWTRNGSCHVTQALASANPTTASQGGHSLQAGLRSQSQPLARPEIPGLSEHSKINV